MKKTTMSNVIKEVARRTNCSKNDAKEVLEHFSDVVAESLSKGEDVGFKHFGTFSLAISASKDQPIVLFQPSTTILRKMAQKGA